MQVKSLQIQQLLTLCGDKKEGNEDVKEGMYKNKFAYN